MSKRRVWVAQSPIEVVEDEEFTWAIKCIGAENITSPTVKVYRNGEDITSTVIPTGSASASGNVITLPEIQIVATDGGVSYVVVVWATIDGSYRAVKMQLDVLSASGKQT